MKKPFLFTAAVAALMTCACSVDPVDSVDVQPREEGEITVLTAGFSGAETRTVRQADGKVFWSPGDAISVIKGVNTFGNKFDSDNTEPAATTTFRGIMPAGEGTGFWALYPYDPNAFFDGEYLWTELPNEQEGVPGTFADNTFISATYADSDQLTFSHVTGGIKFNVTDPGITKVTLKAGQGSVLSGGIGLGIFNDKPAVMNNRGPTYNYVELTPRGGRFIPGEAYHIVTTSIYLTTGCSLIFDRMDGAIAYQDIQKRLLIQGGRFVVLKDIDKKLKWEEDVFTFSPEQVSVGASGGVFVIRFRSLVDYHIDSAVSWIHLKSIDGNPRLREGATATFTVDANPGEERTGIVTVCNDKTGNCYPVVVTQASGIGLKGLKHHSLGMRFTATWCYWCPYMDASFQKAKVLLGDRFDYMNLHGANSELFFSGTGDLEWQYWVDGYPTGIVDGRVEIENGTDTDLVAQEIVDAVGQQEDFYPPMTAIGLASSLSGRNLTVEGEVFAQEAGTYKLSVYLLEDGIVHYQNNGGDDYVHDRVARMVLTGEEGDSVSVARDNGTRSFTYTASIPAGYNLENMSVLAFVQRKFDSQVVIQSGDYGEWYIDNCRIAKLGATAPLEVE
jgi:hypothetical protein